MRGQHRCPTHTHTHTHLCCRRIIKIRQNDITHKTFPLMWNILFRLIIVEDDAEYLPDSAGCKGIREAFMGPTPITERILVISLWAFSGQFFSLGGTQGEMVRPHEPHVLVVALASLPKPHSSLSLSPSPSLSLSIPLSLYLSLSVSHTHTHTDTNTHRCTGARERDRENVWVWCVSVSLSGVRSVYSIILCRIVCFA
jgi:hypothetical protein